jgi:hypothetical protein
MRNVPTLPLRLPAKLGRKISQSAGGIAHSPQGLGPIGLQCNFRNLHSLLLHLLILRFGSGCEQSEVKPTQPCIPWCCDIQSSPHPIFPRTPNAKNSSASNVPKSPPEPCPNLRRVTFSASQPLNSFNALEPLPTCSVKGAADKVAGKTKEAAGHDTSHSFQFGFSIFLGQGVAPCESFP